MEGAGRGNKALNKRERCQGICDNVFLKVEGGKGGFVHYSNAELVGTYRSYYCVVVSRGNVRRNTEEAAAPHGKGAGMLSSWTQTAVFLVCVLLACVTAFICSSDIFAIWQEIVKCSPGPGQAVLADGARAHPRG